MTKPHMWKERIKADFHLGIVLLFSTITILAVVPFSTRRFLVDEPVAGTLGLLIMACIASGAAHAWRTGRTRGASNFIAATYCLFCVGIVDVVQQPAAVLWVFPVLVANFLLVSRVHALMLSSAVIAGVLIGDGDLATGVDQLTFLATALMVSLFSFVFASRTEVQRAQLEAAALRDPLTGAGNRRGLDAELDIAMAASIRSGEPLGFLVFDIDLFKRVNDSFGHEAGDQVLRATAALVQARTRTQDRFYRLGGEEFGLLLPGAGPESLREVAEKLRQAVECEVQCGGIPVTISLGAAPFRPGETAAEWLSRADAAMYEAKRSGRNRTVMAATAPLRARADAGQR
ncbi:GGDEF domain-containing protein [Luteimonas changyuni]|uniref:GGDEF domain-containing protein n=1 Tax=Luteimonas sp. MJ145 TaxID=3129234 RepID=UPI0031BB95AE